MDTIDVPVFEEAVRDCLAHLYDYNFLQEHPLVRLLIPYSQGNISRVQAFQQLVLSAIDRIKPFEQNASESKNSRLYNILSLRYQQKYQVQYVLRQLNLGERQYYRDHAKAVQALAQVLDEQLKEQSTAPVPLAHPLSIQTELDRVQRQSTPLTDAEVFLHKTLSAIQALSARQQVTVTIRCIDPALPDGLDQTLLRQVIIWISSQLLMITPARSHLEMVYDNTPKTVQFSFLCKPELGADQIHPMLEGPHETLEMLLNTLGARLYPASMQESGVALTLEVASQQHSLLIIDDNPDAISLFRQFLVGQPHQILTAHDGMQAITLAQRMRPEVIILDVLLPNQDGWEILQRLKNHPATMSTPIIICSVLDAADLAMMLGADAFILKPPQESEFLDILRHVTQRAAL